jgi:ribokinase
LPGETLLGGLYQTFPGGKGANQAVAIARLGAPVSMIGRVGADAFGAELLQGLAQDGVDISPIYQDPEAATGVALITVSEDGQNTIVLASGANMRVSVQEVEAQAERIRQASLLVMQLESPLEVVMAAARLAHQSGVGVILNPAPARPLPPELFKNIDYIIPNQNELKVLVGEQLPVSEAARRLQDKGTPTVLVTLGEEGVYLLSEGIETSLPAFEVQAVDTVAAGDAFVGALAVALAEDQPLEQAARWGVAAGAIAVTRHGAQPSLPTRTEILRLLGGG